MNLQKRQKDILAALLVPLSTSKLLRHLESIGFSISEDTLQRELKLLTTAGLVLSEGAGPSRMHVLTSMGRMSVDHTELDIDKYLQDEDRLPSRYLTDVPKSMVTYLRKPIFGSDEQAIVTRYRQFESSLDDGLLARWRQKWLIEFAWKSSSIEGNTYSILETETLLLDKVEAVGKSHQEALMIVNHQKAYNFILEHRADFRSVTLSQVLKLHELLVQDLDVSFGIRTAAVRISGSKYIPLHYGQQIAENLEHAVEAINIIEEPLDKALLSILLIAYLQPFADGNKRTSRVLANAILESYNYPPIILGGINPTRYRRACIAFYELTDIEPMMQIIKDSYAAFLDFE
jgi:fido (protein-threonine AMPylation protein)